MEIWQINKKLDLIIWNFGLQSKFIYFALVKAKSTLYTTPAGAYGNPSSYDEGQHSNSKTLMVGNQTLFTISTFKVGRRFTFFPASFFSSPFLFRNYNNSTSSSILSNPTVHIVDLLIILEPLNQRSTFHIMMVLILEAGSESVRSFFFELLGVSK